MKHLLLLGMVVLSVSGACFGAQEYELAGLGTRVQGMVDATVQSRYLWRGFDWFGNRAAWQLTAGPSAVAMWIVSVGMCPAITRTPLAKANSTS